MAGGPEKSEAETRDAPRWVVLGVFLEAIKHLGAFIKHAPMELIHVFLKTVGNAMLERFKTIEDDGFHAISKDHKKLWLSTSGLGVKWVHVRIDSSPKYYNWEPYSNTLFGR